MFEYLKTKRTRVFVLEMKCNFVLEIAIHCKTVLGKNCEVVIFELTVHCE